MELVKKEIELPKEVAELMEGLVKIIEASKLALEDGFQPGLDLPAVLVASVSELPKMVGGLDQLDDEFKAHPDKMLKAVAMGAADIAGVLLKK